MTPRTSPRFAATALNISDIKGGGDNIPEKKAPVEAQEIDGTDGTEESTGIPSDTNNNEKGMEDPEEPMETGDRATGGVNKPFVNPRPAAKQVKPKGKKGRGRGKTR